MPAGGHELKTEEPILQGVGSRFTSDLRFRRTYQLELADMLRPVLKIAMSIASAIAL